MAIIISFYNHKGGIGKTTATYNIGYILSEVLGKKVLLVDLDPQSNLTWLIKYRERDEAEKFYAECQAAARETSAKEIAEAKAEGKPVRKVAYKTLREALQPSLEVTRERPIDIAARAKRTHTERVADYQHLDLLPGHLDVGNLDIPMTLGSAGVPGTQAFVAQLTNFLRLLRTDKKEPYDFILLDLGPGTGGLNKCMIMGSDYLCAPYQPEYFCKVAFDNLRTLLPTWHREFETRKLWDLFEREEDDDDADKEEKDSDKARPHGPVFLGSFPQRVRSRKEKGGMHYDVIESHLSWLERIRTSIGNLCEELAHDPMHLISDKFPHDALLFGVPDEQSLALDVMHSGKPVSDLTHKHLHMNKEGKFVSSYGTKKLPMKSLSDSTSSAQTNKQKAALAFRRITGTLMKGLLPRDLDLLGDDFRKHIELMADMYEGIKPSLLFPKEVSAKQKEKAEAAGEGKKPIKKRDSYKFCQYDSDDVNATLAHYIGDSEDIGFLAPLANIDNRDAFRANVTQYLQNYKRTLTDTHNNEDQQIFFPINLGGAHWVLLILRFAMNKRNVECLYFDPLGHNIEAGLSTLIRGCLRVAFPALADDAVAPTWEEEKMIISLDSRVQFDHFNCGPWIVEAARKMAHDGASIPARTHDITAAREEHYRDCLRTDRRNRHAAALPSPSPEDKKVKHSKKRSAELELEKVGAGAGAGAGSAKARTEAGPSLFFTPAPQQRDKDEDKSDEHKKNKRLRTT